MGARKRAKCGRGVRVRECVFVASGLPGSRGAASVRGPTARACPRCAFARAGGAQQMYPSARSRAHGRRQRRAAGVRRGLVGRGEEGCVPGTFCPLWKYEHSPQKGIDQVCCLCPKTVPQRLGDGTQGSAPSHKVSFRFLCNILLSPLQQLSDSQDLK